MACCGDDEAETKQLGVVKERKCRDVLCLLFFLAFWVGMFVICGFAAKNGDVNRLVYGVDSYGFSCGSSTTFNNLTVDNTDNKNLYFLNPLELLTVANIPFAKSICLNGCPGPQAVCDHKSLPCTNNTQYYCPYLAFAQYNLSAQLPGVPPTSVQWWANLTSMQPVADPNATANIQRLQSLNSPWINQWLTTYNITASNGLVSGAYYQLISQIPGVGPCYPVWVATTPFFNRCFPSFSSDWATKVVNTVASSDVGSATVDAFKDAFNSVSQQWNRYVSSISRGLVIIIVGGLCGGVVLSLISMVILRYLAGLMAWLTVILVNVALLAVTLFCFSFAGLLAGSGVGAAISDALPAVADPTTVDRSTWKWIGVASAIVTGLVFLLTLLSISRIRIAVACIKVTSQAVGAMPGILLFPLLPFVFEVGLVVYWIAVTAWLYSAGVLTANCRSSPATPLTFSELSEFYSTGTLNTTSAYTGTYTCYQNTTTDERASLCGSDPNCYLSYDWNNKLRYAFIYHFFGLLWTQQVLVGFACVTIAGAVASYYFSGGNKAELPALPVVVAMKNTTVYHMGSVAFGAFVIAFVQLIRFLLEYLDRKTKAIQEANTCAAWAMCCVKCCVCCLEKILQFINRNAFVMVGVKGTSYCVSAFRAMSLIVSNALRLAVVNVVGDLVLFLGKVFIAASCGVIAFCMSTLPAYSDPETHPSTYIGSPVLPVALSIIVGFIVAELFFAVWEMGMDTIILSFCEDCEEHGGNPRFAPELLLEVMNSSDEQVAKGPAAVKPIAG